MPRKKQRREFGSITEAVKGKRYVCRWMENTERGRVRRSKTIRGTRRDAAAFLAKKQLEVGSERRVPTYQEAYEMWYLPWLERRVVSGDVREATAATYRRVWDTVIGPEIGPSCVDKLPILTAQRWLLGLSKQRAETCLTIVRKVASFTARFVEMGTNPFSPEIEYELPRSLAWRKSTQTYDLATAARVMDAVRGSDMLEAPYIMAAFGGARVTEAAAIKPAEMERVVHDGVEMAVVPIVRHTKSAGADTTDDGVLKNAQSVRWTIVPEPWCRGLFEIAERRAEAGVPWMCDRGDGLPLNGQLLKYRWNQFLDGHPELPRIPFSNLRKSWRTYMEMDYGLPDKICEVLMGHRLKGVTGEHYFVLRKEQALSAMAQAVRRVGII